MENKAIIDGLTFIKKTRGKVFNYAICAREKDQLSKLHFIADWATDYTDAEKKANKAGKKYCDVSIIETEKPFVPPELYELKAMLFN